MLTFAGEKMRKRKPKIKNTAAVKLGLRSVARQGARSRCGSQGPDLEIVDAARGPGAVLAVLRVCGRQVLDMTK